MAVASTDKNGEASFPAITEAPGTRFNFDTGAVERPEAAGPENLYTGREKADAVQDNERFEGHSGSGHSLTLQDSADGDGTEYRKLTSNQGVAGLAVLCSSAGRAEATISWSWRVPKDMNCHVMAQMRT